MIGSSVNVILRLIRNVEYRAEKGLCDILFGVHHIDVVRKFEVLEIGKLREGGNVSPVMRLTISLEAFGFGFAFAFAFALAFSFGFGFGFAFAFDFRLESF